MAQRQDDSGANGSPNSSKNSQAAPQLSATEQLLALMAQLPQMPSAGFGVALPGMPKLEAFNPNVDMNALIERARTILAPTKTEKEQGYNSALNKAKTAYDQLIADIGRQSGSAIEQLKASLTQRKEDNTVDANRRGMFWSGVLDNMNQKADKQYSENETKLLQEKQYQEGSAARQYTSQKTDLETALANLAGLMEQQAASLASSDLYNQEYAKQKDVWSANNQVANQGYNMALDRARIQQSVAQANAQMQQQGYLSQLDNAMKMLNMQNDEKWKTLQYQSQYDPTDKLMAQDVALSQYKNQLLTAMNPYMSLEQPKRAGDVGNWNSAYGSLQSTISAMPGFAQDAVTQYFKSTPWYQNYTSAQAWKPSGRKIDSWNPSYKFTGAGY